MARVEKVEKAKFFTTTSLYAKHRHIYESFRYIYMCTCVCFTILFTINVNNSVLPQVTINFSKLIDILQQNYFYQFPENVTISHLVLHLNNVLLPTFLLKRNTGIFTYFCLASLTTFVILATFLRSHIN